MHPDTVVRLRTAAGALQAARRFEQECAAERDQAILDALARGYSTRSVAAAVGTSQQRVVQVARASSRARMEVGRPAAARRAPSNSPPFSNSSSPPFSGSPSAQCDGAPPCSVRASGVDTASIVWRPARSDAWWRDLEAAVRQGYLALSMPMPGACRMHSARKAGQAFLCRASRWRAVRCSSTSRTGSSLSRDGCRPSSPATRARRACSLPVHCASGRPLGGGAARTGA